MEKKFFGYLNFANYDLLEIKKIKEVIRFNEKMKEIKNKNKNNIGDYINDDGSIDSYIADDLDYYKKFYYSEKLENVVEICYEIKESCKIFNDINKNDLFCIVYVFNKNVEEAIKCFYKYKLKGISKKIEKFEKMIQFKNNIEWLRERIGEEEVFNFCSNYILLNVIKFNFILLMLDIDSGKKLDVIKKELINLYGRFNWDNIKEE